MCNYAILRSRCAKELHGVISIFCKKVGNRVGKKLSKAKALTIFYRKGLIFMVRPARFELTAFGSGGQRSIQLSYERARSALLCFARSAVKGVMDPAPARSRLLAVWGGAAAAAKRLPGRVDLQRPSPAHGAATCRKCCRKRRCSSAFGAVPPAAFTVRPVVDYTEQIRAPSGKARHNLWDRLCKSAARAALRTLAGRPPGRRRAIFWWA